MVRITQIIGNQPIEPSVLDQDVLEQRLVKEGRFHFPTNQMIFVFGSNEAGRHGAGAAYYAAKHKGAVSGVGFGAIGVSFAIPTKDRQLITLGLHHIEAYVKRFLTHARMNPRTKFQVTQIGCGLAGLKKEDIAPMFYTASKNCLFDTEWEPVLPATATFWGTFP